MNDIIIYPTSDSSTGENKLPIKKKCFGIDLGTTATIMCYVDSEYVDLKENASIPIQFVKIRQISPFEYHPTLESEKVASILGIYKGKVYIGSNLYHLKGHREFEYKKNLFYHWKLELGIDHHPMYPNALFEKVNMPYKVAAGILNYIRKSRFGDTSMSNTIITVPASFQANQRKDVLRAAELAKIETAENMLIDEPNAAFLGYFNRLSNEEKVKWAKNVQNKNVLVVDFGGGTLDLSILNVDFKKDTGITISNRAISRYNDLGGQDIDTLIAEEFLVPKLKKIFDEFDEIDSIDVRDIILPQLALIGEGLKIGISDKLSVRAGAQNVNNIDLEGISYEHTDCRLKYRDKEYDLGNTNITAKEFKDLFTKLFVGRNYSFKYIDKKVSTISSSISDIIKKASLGFDEIEFMLFVGGSSFNPFLHSLCKEILIKSRSLTSHEPDKLVSEGAAVYSYFLNVHNISLISPITSDTIGVVVKDNRFFPILERGQSLPKHVSLPDFRFQTNINREVVIPVCINGVDFPIGEIRSELSNSYDLDTVVKIEAEITIDKVFRMKVFANDDLIGDAEFENPYGHGKLTEDELDIFKHKEKMNKAKLAQNFGEEKETLKSLIWKYSDVENYRGVIESAEEYNRRFDDKDEGIWNMLYVGNNRLGRTAAAGKALQRAIELAPDAPALHYNYSILLSQTNNQEALDYLEHLIDDLKSDIMIRCRIIHLKDILGQDVEKEASVIVYVYKDSPGIFSEFTKEKLLGDIFKIAKEPYAFVDPKKERKTQDYKNYLDIDN